MSKSRKSLELSTFSVSQALQYKRAKRASRILLKDGLKKMSTPDGILSFLLASDERSGAGLDLDFYLTIIRIYGVFRNAINNNANNDAGPAHYEGALAWTLVGGGVAVSVIGFGRALYQYLHAQYLKTTVSYQKRLKKLAPHRLDSREVQTRLAKKIAERVNNFAESSYKAITKAAKEKRLQQPLFATADLTSSDIEQQLIDDLDDELLSLFVSEGADLRSEKEKARLVRRIQNLVSVLRADEIDKEIKQIKEEKVTDFLKIENQHPKSPLPAFIRAVNVMRDNTFMDGIRVLWKWGGNFSYIYWLIWMPVAIVSGLAVAAASAEVVLATLATGGFFMLWAAGKWIGQKLGWVKQDPTGAEKKVENEDARKTHEAKVRLLAVKAHDSAMKVIYGDKWEAKKAELAAAKKSKKEKIDGDKKLLNEDYQRIFSVRKLKTVKADSVNNDGLVRRLTGSVAEQRFRLFIAATSMISTYVGFSFLMWFGTTALGVVFAPLLAAWGLTTGSSMLAATVSFLANDLGGAIVAAAAGGGLGAIGSLFDVAKLYTEQTAYEDKVYAVLSAQYKNTDKSNFEVHSGLVASLRDKINALKAVKDKLSPEQLKMIGNIELSLNTKPHTGIRYFEKFEFVTPVFSIVKQVWDGIYDFATQGQTGIFCARNLFLASGAAAGALVGITFVTGGTALIPFLIAAVALMVFVGAVGVVKAQLDRRQKHREEALNSELGQIKTYKKWEQELVAIANVTDAAKLCLSHADQPDIAMKNPELNLAGLDLARVGVPVPFATAGKVSMLTFLGKKARTDDELESSQSVRRVAEFRA